MDLIAARHACHQRNMSKTGEAQQMLQPENTSLRICVVLRLLSSPMTRPGPGLNITKWDQFTHHMGLGVTFGKISGLTKT